MQIKVCGVTTFKQLQQLDGLEIGFAGLIFNQDSPRYAAGSQLKEELMDADLDIKKVGVFTNQEIEEIMQIVDDYDLDVVQLHGEESAELCRELSSHVETIKVIRFAEDNPLHVDKLLEEYDAVVDYYLFDMAAKNGYGGTGRKINWAVVAKGKIEKPFFLGGGISPADTAAIKNFSHPDFYGIDINSRFEKEPGVKDMPAILRFKHELSLSV